MKNILISYFSASGVTKRVAENIKDAIGGDLFEIIPTERYTEADLDWTNSQSRSSIEMKDPSSRPGIDKKVENIDAYDTVVLGFPIWWYTAPTIIHTFLEENDLTKKNIYVFATSGSSSVTKSFEDLKQAYPNLTFISAKRFSGNESKEGYKAWIQ